LILERMAVIVVFPLLGLDLEMGHVLVSLHFFL
jgi:hypothetical protein